MNEHSLICWMGMFANKSWMCKKLRCVTIMTKVKSFLNLAGYGLLASTVSMGLLTACNQQKEKTVAAAEPLKVVSYLVLGQTQPNNQMSKDNNANATSTSLQAQQAAPVRKLSGQVASAETTNLSFEASGKVKRMMVKLGDRVKRGQVLAVLDDTNYQLQLHQAQAQLQKAISQRNQAKVNVARRTELVKIGAVSQAEIDSVNLAFSTAQDSVEVAKASVALAQKQAVDTQLRAPFSGVITQKIAEVGQMASPSVPIYTMATDSAPKVKFTIPENLLNSVSVGQPLAVNFPALPNIKGMGGVVTEVSSQAVAGAFPVTLQLKKATRRIKPGMTAEVALPVTLTPFNPTESTTQNSTVNKDSGKQLGTSVFAVPPSAVASGDGQNRYVLRIKQKKQSANTGVVEQVFVQVADLAGENMLIRGNLNAGDKIVRAGTSILADKQEVELMGTGARRVNP